MRVCLLDIISIMARYTWELTNFNALLNAYFPLSIKSKKFNLTENLSFELTLDSFGTVSLTILNPPKAPNSFNASVRFNLDIDDEQVQTFTKLIRFSSENVTLTQTIPLELSYDNQATLHCIIKTDADLNEEDEFDISDVISREFTVKREIDFSKQTPFLFSGSKYTLYDDVYCDVHSDDIQGTLEINMINVPLQVELVHWTITQEKEGQVITHCGTTPRISNVILLCARDFKLVSDEGKFTLTLIICNKHPF